MSNIKNKVCKWLAYRGWFNRMSDVGYKLDLDNPKTFNEKLQWLKLYDRKEEYTSLVDKYEVKSIVAEIIGEEYIIPTLGLWDNVEDIDFDKLPDKFVLKCTHDRFYDPDTFSPVLWRHSSVKILGQ